MSKPPAGVPASEQPTFDAIVTLTDAVAATHLNAEYAALCREMAAKLARKRPSPLRSGKPASWAAGIAGAIGRTNFLDDRSSRPYLPMKDLFAAFGVAAGTGNAKARQIGELLKIGLMDPAWTLPSRLGDNPLIWMLSVNGFMIDVRHASRELQEVAYHQGLIPYIPADRERQTP